MEQPSFTVTDKRRYPTPPQPKGPQAKAKRPSGDKIRIKELEEQVYQLQWCVAELHYVVEKLAQYVTLEALRPALRERMAAEAQTAQQAMIARALMPTQ